MPRPQPSISIDLNWYTQVNDFWVLEPSLEQQEHQRNAFHMNVGGPGNFVQNIPAEEEKDPGEVMEEES